MGWRLIDTDLADPYYVTAADEMLSQARTLNKTQNTLHYYRRHPPAVSLGRSRKIHDDVNVKECETNNVKIIRRTTGGGTIYTDKNCFIYSCIFDRKDYPFSSSTTVFNTLCQCLITTLNTFDIYPIYKPPNDLLLNGKKISGSAQLKKHNTILIHGTLLVDTDLEVMNKVLNHQKPGTVSTITQETGINLPMNELKKTFNTQIEHTFHTTLKHTTFTSDEQKRIQTLLHERYLHNSWNYMR